MLTITWKYIIKNIQLQLSFIDLTLLSMLTELISKTLILLQLSTV